MNKSKKFYCWTTIKHHRKTKILSNDMHLRFKIWVYQNVAREVLLTAPKKTKSRSEDCVQGAGTHRTKD